MSILIGADHADWDVHLRAGIIGDTYRQISLGVWGHFCLCIAGLAGRAWRIYDFIFG